MATETVERRSLRVVTLRPVVLLVQDYVGKLEGYHPETPALQDVHRQYIGVWRSHQLACETIVEAMEKRDYVLLSKGTKNLNEARSALLTVLDGLSELLVESGLRSPPETGSPSSAAPRGPFPPGNE